MARAGVMALTALVAGAGSGLCVNSARAQTTVPTVYAIAGGGSTLIRFPANNPSAITTVGSFSLNGAATFLDAIDFRPLNGQLYGYLDSADAFYTVNTNTGALTRVSTATSAAPTNTFQLGLDFNPTIDRARLVTDSAQNIVFNPNDGTVSVQTALAYAIGDANENTSPSIIDNAYSNNRAGATTTTQYGIDYGINALVTIANNAGTLATVGPLGVDATVYTGFDIYTDALGANTAYAVMSDMAGAPTFYTINLTTGAATAVGALGSAAGTQVYSLAVVPAPAMVLPLGVGVMLVRRRQR